MNIDWDTASTSPEPPSSPQSSVKAWSPPPFPWPSNAAPMTSTQSNPMEQSQGFGQMAAWGDATVSETCMRADLFLWMQPSSSYVNPQEATGFDRRSVARVAQERILGFGNGKSIDTWSSLQANESINVAPTNLNQYNPMEQPQNYGQTAGWSVDSAPPASNLVDNPFPRMEFQSGHVNLQEGGSFEARGAATPLAPPQFSVDTGYSQHSTWSSDVAPPTSTQYNPMELFQDYGQTPVWSGDSAPAAPDMVNTSLPRLQPSGSPLNSQEVVTPKPICATASAPPCSSVDTGSSDVAPPTSTQCNTMEQFQDLGLTPTWSVDSLPVAPYVDADQLPGTQPFYGYMFPPEIGHLETRCAVGVEQKGCLGPGNAKRKKGQRYDEQTVLTLEKYYLKNPYLNRAQKKDLMNQTGLTSMQVKSWFQRRRRDVNAGIEIKNFCVDNGNNIDTWSMLQLNGSSNVAPTTFYQYNPMEQPPNYGQTAAWSINAAPLASDIVDNPFPGMEFQRGHVNLQEECPFEASDAATASAPPQFSVDTGYSQHSTWSSDVAPSTATQYNPMEQIQDPGQTAVWSVNSAPAAPDMVNTPLPRLQISGSHMNPQEVVPSEPTCLTAYPCSSVDTRYSQHSTWPTNVAKPTFTQYNQMEQIQDPVQTPVWSGDSAPVAPYMDADQLPGTQPFNGNMISLEIGHSEARCAVGIEHKGSFGPENGIRKKWAPHNEQTTSTLEEHYLENPYPSTALKKDLAKQTGLTMKQIRSWFENRRKRDPAAGVEITNRRHCINPFHERTHQILKRHYLEDRFPKMARKKDLADQTGLTPKQVRDWFSKCRHRDRLAAQTKMRNETATDAVNCHSVESTSTEDFENADPLEQPMYACQALTSKTLTNGNLSPPMAISVPIPSMPMFDNLPMMAPECFQMQMQQFPPQMAPNPTFQQTTALQNSVQSPSANFYY